MNIKEEIVKEIEKLNKEYLYEKNGTIYCRDEEAKKFFWYA